MRRILPILITILALALFSSCSPEVADENKTVRVMVTECEGITVEGENPKDIPVGSDVTFDVKINTGYVFDGVSVGEYNIEEGKLTVKDVEYRTRVKFEIANVGYDSSKKYAYIFKGGENDQTSVSSNQEVNAGTKITVTAGANDKRFVGWSFGGSYEMGADIVSFDRTFTFRLSPEFTDTKALIVYPNYVESNVFYYDSMDGEINKSSYNLESNDYYKAEVDGDRIKITLLEKYFEYADCASLFYDDGTFSRDGYVLKEYNTKPDGSGDAYSLGSKYYPGEGETIYCIWEPSASQKDFLWREVSMPKAKEIKYAERWYDSGVEIFEYSGSGDKLTVPEYIDGKPVISIAEGAFKNEEFSTLILPKTLQRISDGAFTECTRLETMYFPNGIYELSDKIFDEKTYENFTRLIVNATVAPRNTKSTDGGFAVKLSRVIAHRDEKLVIVISGSSSFQGLSTPYLEALLDGEYRVINFGTTRPRPGLFYLEALSHYTDEGDIFVYAPENSAYMFGEQTLTWRFLYDLEGMNNLFRYVDISNYKNYFSSFAELNRDKVYVNAPKRYEEICENGYKTGGSLVTTDKNGDYQHPNREGYYGLATKYNGTYFITFNNRVKSIYDVNPSDKEYQEVNKDYSDLNNTTWTSIDRPDLVAQMNMAISKAQASGAKVYFSFAPTDENDVVAEARNVEWLQAYDKLIDEIYCFDGRLGSCMDYIFDHNYAYDCAFHVNDYGRTWRTYQMYEDICEKLGITDVKNVDAVGTDFAGCLFEEGTTTEPRFGVDYLQ